MGNGRVRRWLTQGRQWLPIAGTFAALALPIGILAISRLKAEDQPVPGPAAPVSPSSAAPALMPLPPSAVRQVPLPPSDAASTTASDDTPAAGSPILPPPIPVPSTATSPTITSQADTWPTAAPPTAASSIPTPPAALSPLSADSPPITLQPPIELSNQQSPSEPIFEAASPAASIHADVAPINDWSLPPNAKMVTNPTLQPASTPAAADAVVQASAAIEDASSVAAAPTGAAASSAIDESPAELPELPALEVQAPQFREIQPGATTSEDLVQRWGEGKLQHLKDGSVQRVYTPEHYRQVTVTLEHRRVASITVQLPEPAEPETFAQRLHLDPDSSVPVSDESGQSLGQSFPDHGTLFSYDAGTKLVSVMMLEPIDPQPFLLRSAYEADLHPGWGLRDVDYALRLDPAHAESHDLRSQILLAIGRPGDALKSANRSVALAPDNAAFQLSKAVVLARLDRHDEALKLTQSVVDRTDLSAILKAHALCQLAELSAGQSGGDKHAIDLFMSAIKTAQPLATDDHVAVRRLAKHLLLEAHLGAASDIAWGVWQKKSVTVARWIRQADQLAQDLIDHEEGDPQLRLDVARFAVSASAGTDGQWDAANWVQQALESGRKLIAEADDPLRKDWLEWELGSTLVDALEVQRTIGLNAESLSHAMAVLKYLQSGIQYRQRTAETMYVLGRAYFQIGVAHAVVDRDHTTAVLWFDRAVPLLDRPLPPSARSRIGRNGELLVSMGISYWQTGNHDEGLRLTQRGAELMSKAVAMQLLNDGALAVPYNNLAAMHRQMGHKEQARSYAEMAAQHDRVHR